MRSFGDIEISVFLVALFLLPLVGCIDGVREGVLKKDLSGIWRFKADPEKVGEKEGWFREDYDDSEWRDFRVPGVWNEGRNAGVEWNYSGYGWFRRRFTVPKGWRGYRLDLRFLAVYLIADVWLNGEYLGRHRGGYTAFGFDVTDKLNYDGPNLLVVRADNTGRRFQVPWHSIDWWNCGGISREVYLERRPLFSLKNLFITPRLTPKSGIELRVEFEDKTGDLPAAHVYVEVRFRGKPVSRTGIMTVKPDENGEWRLSRWIDIPNPHPWSPDEPNLYRLNLYWRLKGERTWWRTAEKFGLREVEVRGTELYLNGEKIFLQGLALHQDYPGMGSAVTKKAQREDLMRIKRLNANFVRLGHYPFHPYSLEVCDEIGLLTWLEIPVWQNSPEELADERMYRDWVKPQLDEMIDQYSNHPSVIFWSVGNEFSRAWLPNREPPQTIGYVKRTTEYVRSRDRSRLVTYASAASTGYGTWKFLDVIGKPLHYGWFHSKNVYDIGPQTELIHRYAPDKPILAIELCGMSEEGRHAGYGADERWSMEYHDKLLRVLIQNLMIRKDYVCGVTVWTLADLKGGRERGTYGLFNRERQVKFLYDTVRNLFTRDPKLLIIEPKTLFQPGETFNVELWGFNRLKDDFGGCKVEWWITGLIDGRYSRLASGELNADIPADSAVKLGEVNWRIPGDAEGFHTLNVRLLDESGEELFFNDLHFDVGQPTPPAILRVESIEGVRLRLEDLERTTDYLGIVHFLMPEGRYKIIAIRDGEERSGEVLLKRGETTRYEVSF
jgi:hypothetical protein